MLYETAPWGDFSIGSVSFCEDGRYGVVRDCELRDLPLFAPAGIRYLPLPGQRAALISHQGTAAMLGVLAPADDSLAPGELKLCCGAGFIHLKATGEVVINGVTITPEGKILPKEEAM